MNGWMEVSNAGDGGDTVAQWEKRRNIFGSKTIQICLQLRAIFEADTNRAVAFS